MDALTSATAFASIVSLLADFLAQRHNRAAQNYDEFMAWLQTERHDEIKTLLEANAKTVIGIKAILNEDRTILTERFNRLDRSLAAFASAVDGFSALAEAIRPEARLSRQALGLLRQFEESGASEALYVTNLSTQPMLVTMGVPQVEIAYDEPRFLEDDLASLVALGLLRESFSSSGSPIFAFTRAASDLVRSIHGDV